MPEAQGAGRSPKPALVGSSPTSGAWLKRLELWLERQPLDNPVSRAVDRRRKNDRLIVEAIDG